VNDTVNGGNLQPVQGSYNGSGQLALRSGQAQGVWADNLDIKMRPICELGNLLTCRLARTVCNVEYLNHWFLTTNQIPRMMISSVQGLVSSDGGLRSVIEPATDNEVKLGVKSSMVGST
jgi:hypothetical protein